MMSSSALTWTLCALLTCSTLIQSSVFLDQPSADQVLRSASRRRRANSFFLEEMLPGDLERECYEESCSQEEAAEIFKTREKTMEFWFRYISLNPCQVDPCLNGGKCHMERGDFTCLCPPQYHGKTCESAVSACRYRNGGCLQYCRDLPGGAAVQCGCAEGFKLDPNGLTCSRTVMFPCGVQRGELIGGRRSLTLEMDNVSMETENVSMETENVSWETDSMWVGNSTESWILNLTLTQSEEELLTVNASSAEREANWTGLTRTAIMPRIVGGALERPGGSPWQVLLRRADGYGFCGGTLVSDRWVISAAHCLEQTVDHITLGDFDKQRPDPGEQLIKVQQVFVHPHFHSFTFDSDVALILLSRPVLRGPTTVPACLPDPHLAQYLLQVGNRGVVTGWGLTRYLGRSSRFLRKVTLPVVSYKDCTASTDQVITDNMFCAGYLEVGMDACSGDSGGPFVVNYRGTWFLTGVVSWGEKCAARGKYGVYTRLGNFLTWIHDTMQRQDLNSTDS